MSDHTSAEVSSQPCDLGIIEIADELAAEERYAEAAAGLQSSLTNLELTCGKQSGSIGLILDKLAYCLMCDHRSSEAIPHSERSRHIWNSIAGEPSIELAGADFRLGILKRTAGRIEEAYSHFQSSVAQLESLGRTDEDFYDGSLCSVVGLGLRMGRLDESSASLNALYEVRLRRHDRRSRPMAEVLRLAAELAIFRGNLDSAYSAANAAVIALNSSRLTQPMALLSAMETLGRVARAKGDYFLANTTFARGVAMLNELPQNTSQMKARFLWNRGDLAIESDDFPTADESLHESLRILSSELEPDPFMLMAVHGSLGVLYGKLRNPEKATSHFHTSLSLVQDWTSNANVEVARIVVSYSGFLMEWGDAIEAERHVRLGLSLLEKQAAQIDPAYSIGLSTLAQIVSIQGDDSGAHALATRAVAFSERSPALNLTSKISILNTAALIAQWRRDYTQAAAYTNIARSILGNEPINAVEEARLCGLEAQMHSHAGNPADALQLQQRVLDILSTSFGPNSDRLSTPLTNVSRTALSLHMTDLAVATAVSACRISLIGIGNYASGVEDRKLLALRAFRLAPLHAAANAAVFGGLSVDKTVLWQCAVDARGYSLRRARSANPTSPSLSDICRRLPPSAALVAYVRYLGPTPRSSRPDSETITPTYDHDQWQYLAFVHSPINKKTSAVYLGSSDRVDSLARVWNSGTPGSIGEAQTESQRLAGLGLRALIWDPVVEELGDVHDIFLVSDGIINGVNFYALPIENRTFLIEQDYVFHPMATEMDLLNWRTSSHEGRGILLFGDPDFDSLLPSSTHIEPAPDQAPPTAPMRLKGKYFVRLSQTGTTLDDIAKQFRHANPDEPVIGPITRHNATVDALLESAPGCRLIHLGTHGVYFGDQYASWFRTHKNRAPWLNQINAGDDPLLLCGIACVGANRHSTDSLSAKSTIATGRQIADLDLSGCQLVVVSACQSGYGIMTVGEGVFSLGRAFSMAGVSAQLLNMGHNTEAASSEWLGSFYRLALEHRLSFADAAKGASLVQLRSNGGPAAERSSQEWASWFLIGD